MLWDWLPGYLEPLIDHENEDERPVGQQLLHLSTNTYLRESARFDLTVTDRLCLLAIYIEEELWPHDTFIGWRAADRLYQHAAEHDPTETTVLTSRALTAHNLSSYCSEEDRLTLEHVARTESLRATQINPTAHAFSVASQCHYGTHTETSLALADAALQLQEDSPWPSLWRAHCLHDLERHAEAAAAYRRVPKDHFKGPSSWRMNLLVSQLASCLWKSGQLDEAYTEFDRILTRYEQQPALAELQYLEEAAEQWPEIQHRLTALKARVPSG